MVCRSTRGSGGGVRSHPGSHMTSHPALPGWNPTQLYQLTPLGQWSLHKSVQHSEESFPEPPSFSLLKGSNTVDRKPVVGFYDIYIAYQISELCEKYEKRM